MVRELITFVRKHVGTFKRLMIALAVINAPFVVGYITGLFWSTIPWTISQLVFSFVALMNICILILWNTFINDEEDDYFS